jgi:pimeloyl-ACP methyl ester carboxylesterase
MASAYAPGMPAGWSGLESPSRVRGKASLAAYLDWLGSDLAARPGRSVLAGHSMGGALAVLACALWPERVAGLVLVSPAGLPLTKPIHRSAAQFARQAASRRFSPRDTLRSLAAFLSAPVATARLGLAVRALDLSEQMGEVAATGVPVAVIGCSSDTLVTPDHCQRAAGLLGARYREVALEGGHMWMFGRWDRFREELLAGERTLGSELVGGAARELVSPAARQPRRGHQQHGAGRPLHDVVRDIAE